MADFCRQCSLSTFGEDFGDLRNLNGPHDTHVICEGCGPTVVNPSGECVTAEHGHTQTPPHEDCSERG